MLHRLPGKYGQEVVPAHGLVAASTSRVRTTAVEFCPLSLALALDLAMDNEFSFPTLGLQTAVTSSPSPGLPAGIDDGFGWASLPLGSGSS